MHYEELEKPDCFDRIPDPIVQLIFNSVSDVKTLIRCRAVSKRFNSLVPESDSLVLKVDQVVVPAESDSFLLSLFKSFIHSLQELISPGPSPTQDLPVQNSPARILRGFERIRSLEIELPCGDLELEKGATIRWRAVYGKTLKSCVILGIRSIKYPKYEDSLSHFDRTNSLQECYNYNPPAERGNDNVEGGVGLKTRVVWTISALIAASARHHVLKDVIGEHKEIERLVVKDMEGEGIVVMDEEGLRECREDEVTGSEDNNDKFRTTVPDVRMRMKHKPWLEIGGGVRVEGATLVVVRPASELDDEGEGDGGLVLGAFDGIYREVVKALIKSKSYLLEMNSF